MTAWHRSWRADIGLRILGLTLCAIAYQALAHLVGMRPPAAPHQSGPLAYLLAAIGFMSASAGTALALLGKHLFDQVEVSARWRILPREES